MSELSSDISIVGLDVGSVAVGVGVIRGDWVFTENWPGVNEFTRRYDVANNILINVQELIGGRPSLVVIEEYTKQRFSHVAFGMGEFGGIFRTLCYQLNFAMLLCPVPSMKGFFGFGSRTKSKEAKEGIEKFLKKKYIDWCFSSSTRKGQFNEIDGLGYAYIGRCVFCREGVSNKQKEILLKLWDKYLIGREFMEI